MMGYFYRSISNIHTFFKIFKALSPFFYIYFKKYNMSKSESRNLFFSRFKTLFRKVEQGTDQKPKRSYIEDMAIPRANFKSQIGNYRPMRGATLLFLLVGMLFLGGCKVKEVPVVEKYETHYIDSVRLKDSVVYIPTERIVDIVPWYDTLHLEAEVAYSDAWIDTNYHIIQGQLVTKQGKLIEIRYVDRWQVKDSIVEIDKPIYIKGDQVEIVKYPWWAWVSLTWAVVTLLLISWKIYKFFKPL